MKYPYCKVFEVCSFFLVFYLKNLISIFFPAYLFFLTIHINQSFRLPRPLCDPPNEWRVNLAMTYYRSTYNLMSTVFQVK